METQSPTAVPRTPVYHFKYQGKSYRMEKDSRRRDDPAAPWYVYFERNKRRYKHSCGSNIKTVAETNAKQYIDAVEIARHSDRQDLLDAFKQRRTDRTPDYATLGAAIAIWEQAPLDIGEAHRRRVVSGLRWAARKVFGADTDPDRLSLGEFNAEFVRRFSAAVTREGDGKSQAALNRWKLSAHSMFRSALCLFQPSVLDFYRFGLKSADGKTVTHAPIAIPDFRPLHDAFREARLFKRVKNPPHHAVSDALIEKTLAEWLKLPRNEFLSVGHALSFGLRVGEMSQIKWHFHTIKSGRPYLEGAADVKSQTGLIQVAAVDPFYSQMIERAIREGWRGAADDYVITGSDNYRREELAITVSAWMRALGWRTTKTNHALRDYVGSMIAVKFSIWDASVFLRHSSVTVTQAHYTNFVTLSKMIDKEKLPVKWAEVVHPLSG